MAQWLKYLLYKGGLELKFPRTTQILCGGGGRLKFQAQKAETGSPGQARRKSSIIGVLRGTLPPRCGRRSEGMIPKVGLRSHTGAQTQTHIPTLISSELTPVK